MAIRNEQDITIKWRLCVYSREREKIDFNMRTSLLRSRSVTWSNRESANVQRSHSAKSPHPLEPLHPLRARGNSPLDCAQYKLHASEKKHEKSRESQVSTRATAGRTCRCSSARLTNLKDDRASRNGDMCLIRGWREDERAGECLLQRTTFRKKFKRWKVLGLRSACCTRGTRSWEGMERRRFSP